MDIFNPGDIEVIETNPTTEVSCKSEEINAEEDTVNKYGAKEIKKESPNTDKENVVVRTASNSSKRENDKLDQVIIEDVSTISDHEFAEVETFSDLGIKEEVNYLSESESFDRTLAADDIVMELHDELVSFPKDHKKDVFAGNSVSSNMEAKKCQAKMTSVCEICHKVFDLNVKLRRHERKAHGKRTNEESESGGKKLKTAEQYTTDAGQFDIDVLAMDNEGGNQDNHVAELNSNAVNADVNDALSPMDNSLLHCDVCPYSCSSIDEYCSHYLGGCIDQVVKNLICPVADCAEKIELCDKILSVKKLREHAKAKHSFPIGQSLR